jgi:hypothetical protein
VQLYCRWSCVLLWMFTLHVSAYMAIFRCVRFLLFSPEGICFAAIVAWRPSIVDRRNGLQLWRMSLNPLGKQRRTIEKQWSPTRGLGMGLTILRLKNRNVTWTDSLDKIPKRQNMDMRFSIELEFFSRYSPAHSKFQGIPIWPHDKNNVLPLLS